MTSLTTYRRERVVRLLDLAWELEARDMPVSIDLPPQDTPILRVVGARGFIRVESWHDASGRWYFSWGRVQSATVHGTTATETARAAERICEVAR
ncbi:hypothetical protein [Spongiactinospora rosea]|nr:hypothetical protein [Spongiactinospora rosea]